MMGPLPPTHHSRPPALPLHTPWNYRSRREAQDVYRLLRRLMGPMRAPMTAVNRAGAPHPLPDSGDAQRAALFFRQGQLYSWRHATHICVLFLIGVCRSYIYNYCHPARQPANRYRASPSHTDSGNLMRRAASSARRGVRHSCLGVRVCRRFRTIASPHYTCRRKPRPSTRSHRR